MTRTGDKKLLSMEQGGRSAVTTEWVFGSFWPQQGAVHKKHISYTVVFTAMGLSVSVPLWVQYTAWLKSRHYS